jgi:hypothetical protein
MQRFASGEAILFLSFKTKEMKKAIYLPLVALALCGCGSNATRTAGTAGKVTGLSTLMEEEEQAENTVVPASLFTLADAEKILGEPAHLEDSSTGKDANAVNYKCTYKANATDAKSGKTGVLYCMYEEFTLADSAHALYTFFKKANERSGAKAIEGMGDEAYYHTDNTNFYFILCRKGKRMFRMKVNKVTGVTSQAEFMEVSKKIAASL